MRNLVAGDGSNFIKTPSGETRSILQLKTNNPGEMQLRGFIELNSIGANSWT
jgi:hypothetical protein